MDNTIQLHTPLDSDQIASCRIGDRVLFSGVIYAARDAAHKRLVALVENEEPLPFDLDGQVIYYVGPTPAQPGQPVGAAGPTTSYRMDPYAPVLIKKGLKGMIGKGARGDEVRKAMKKYKAIYLAAIGGAGALMGKSVESAEVIAYPELGTEAIRRLVVKNFPLIVANDIYGADLYEQGIEKYSQPK